MRCSQTTSGMNICTSVDTTRQAKLERARRQAIRLLTLWLVQEGLQDPRQILWANEGQHIITLPAEAEFRNAAKLFHRHALAAQAQ